MFILCFIKVNFLSGMTKNIYKVYMYLIDMIEKSVYPKQHPFEKKINVDQMYVEMIFDLFEE